MMHADEPRYEFLLRRATEYITGRGGLASEDDVIRHVFGNAAASKLWSPLLRSVLEREPMLSLRGDGVWTIVGYADRQAVKPFADFTAIDVETTGLRPLQHRIIEIAAIRYRAGAEAERFEMLLQPDRSVPSVITRLTGIRDVDLEDAAHFRDIADPLLDFLGDDLLVGHNVGFDLSFIAGEFKRLGRPALANNRFDTLSAANRLLTGLRRKNLGKLAEHLEVPLSTQHRGGSDARMTAGVAFRLAEIAASKGITTPEAFLALGAPMPRGETDGNPRRRNVLDRSLLADIPKRPGVYIMFDGYGHVIYIGKAKNLRDRVSSYFSQALGYTRKMDGLLESLVSIHTEETGSELQALLLESQLIRFYQPRYNTALRTSELYPYIKVNISNDWPKVTLSKERKDDGARYFGPYRSRSMAQKAVDLINATVPLRTCPRSFKTATSYGSPCLRLDLGQCLGPCTGRVDRGTYRTHVNDVIAFLEGDGDRLATRIQEQIVTAAERLDFERAQRLRGQIGIVSAVAEAQKRLRESVARHTMLLAQPSPEPGAREIIMVIEGRRWAQLRAQEDDSARDLAIRLAQSFGRARSLGIPAVDHASLDDTLILNRWLFQQEDHPAIMRFEFDDPAIDWNLMAEWALALPESALAYVTPSSSKNDETETHDADLLLFATSAHGDQVENDAAQE